MLRSEDDLEKLETICQGGNIYFSSWSGVLDSYVDNLTIESYSIIDYIVILLLIFVLFVRKNVVLKYRFCLRLFIRV
jgi:tetrahydromethanopterin S-methyltransferase subunit E